METIIQYFPELTASQIQAFKNMQEVYAYWNARINVISRKDFDSFYTRHVLHSLAISKYIDFPKGAKIIDIGSGGGFPGVPLAVMFPQSEFFLMDSIRKKTKVIQEVASALNLKNIQVINDRSEQHKESYHYMTARAVTALPDFVKMTKHLLKKHHDFKRQGLYYLKGGDIAHEVQPFDKVEVYHLSEYFDEDFFETKKMVYVPLTAFNK